MKIKRGTLGFLIRLLIIAWLTGSVAVPAAASNFGDGYVDDLAVGVPGEDLSGSETNAGVVNVLYGARAVGINRGTQNIHQTLTGMDFSEANDFFGSALAIGDFDCDGYADLAVGVKDESFGTPEVAGAGVVHVIYGRSTGLYPLDSQLLHQGGGLQDTPESGDNFGYALAAGDFNGGCDDLAIGVPFEDYGSPLLSAAGIVQVVYGSPGSGLTGPGVIWTQDDLTGNEVSQAGDHFGQSLAAADFNHDGYDDLAIGVPYETIYDETVIHAGVIQVAYGTSSGLSDENADILWQAADTGDAAPENNDEYGSVLAAGSFNCDRHADLAIGIPAEDTDDTDAGAIQILYGATYGLANGAESNLFTRDRLHPGAGAASDHFGFAIAAGDFDGNGCDDLAVGAPDVDFLSFSAIGLVKVLYGQTTGLSATDYSSLAQAPFGLGGAIEANDRLGYSLASGNFNGDAFADLAIGVPFEDDDGSSPQIHDSGAIHIAFGSSAGLTGAGSQYLYPGANGIGGALEADDRYGEMLAADALYWHQAMLPLIVH